MTHPVVDVRGLTFSYPRTRQPVLEDVTLALDAGWRCLLVGRNGAGKSTLLRLMAGKHMVAHDHVRLLGRSAFHDHDLTHRVAFLGGTFPFNVDARVDEILAHTPQPDPARRHRLQRLLDVDGGWRMHTVSDGQRRRVQVLLGLLHPAEVILLDEVTTDLDVVARADLLQFLREESQSRGATILYATHVLDGLFEWATHLCWLDAGRVRLLAPLADIPDVQDLHRAGAPAPLLRAVERWLREAAAGPVP
jgi:CCR4-NOT complex subunit CAF16